MSGRGVRRAGLMRPLAYALVSLAWVSGSLLSAQTSRPAESEREASVEAPWQGALGIQILVTDDSGAGIPGAQVRLLSEEKGGGPPILVTDDSGRLVVDGLSAGEWQLDVRRAGFMMYTGYLRLDPGRSPEVAFSSRQRTGSFWAPLEVRLAGSGEPPSPAAPRQSDRQRAGKEEEKRSKQRARRERRAERQGVARVVAPEADEAEEEEAPPAEVASAAEDVAAVDKPAEVATRVSEPMPAREETPTTQETKVTEAPVSTVPAPPEPSRRERRSDVARVVAPPTAQPSTSSSDSTDAPSAPPSVASAPSAPERPGLLPNPDLYPAGSCRECRPGEWAVDVHRTVAASRSAACASMASLGDALGGLSEVAQIVDASLASPYRIFAGSLIAEGGNDVLRLLPPEARHEVEAKLAPLVEAGSSCQVVAAVLPEGSQFIGFRYVVAGGRRSGDCRGKEECDLGQARWLDNPGIEKTEGLTVIWGLFENESPAEERVATLRVYFKPPAGWLPPS